MNRMGFGKSWLACATLLGGGCGAIPDIIVDAARASAKEALQEAVGDAVDDVIDGMVGELLDFDDFDLPFLEQGEDEEDGEEFEDDGDAFEDDGEVFDNDGEEVEESDQGTGRAGRAGR